ncbi:YdcF family protein [Kitasatospora sp. NPDC097605]|uniref:YdcF family protein n=1 Tax=Kitasatospora sp. NPDC097605 TaxID=3157226 RepID=UPI0033308222
MDQLFEVVDKTLPSCPPDDHRARLAVQVTVTDGAPRPGSSSFGLVFGADDLLGCWWGDSPATRLRVRLPAELLARFRANGDTVTGTSLAMSGEVGFSADWGELTGIQRCAAGPLFRAYVRALDGRPAAPPGPPTGTGRRAAVVLAAPNDARGTLSTIARARTRRAVELLDTPGTHLVLTGGFGAQFNTTDRPHWRHCAAWLAALPGGAPAVLACLETRHSYDDVLFVDELARHHGIDEVLLVTSDHHAARIRYLAGLVRPDFRVVEVSHPDLPAEESARLRRHDEGALGRTIVSTLLFGRDRLLRPLRRVEEDVTQEVWRLDTTAPKG